MRYLILLALSLLAETSLGQPDFGLNYYSDDVQDGYFLVDYAGSSHLLNNCGEVVHTWRHPTSTFFHSKLTENGELLIFNSQTILTLDWNGSIVRRFDLNNQDFYFTYEVIAMPNGNFLALGRKSWQGTGERINVGLDINRPSAPIYDIVVEVDTENHEIVWQWEIKDHIFQNRDFRDPNYGELEDNVDRLEVSPVYPIRIEEFFMINGMDYNPKLDLIALSIRKSSEVAFIDHSTTTEEAKGNKGGTFDKGGRILYRWGNPQNYGQGTQAYQQLALQHNPNWIEYGPYKDQLIVYDNINGDTALAYSEVLIIDPPMEGGRFSKDSSQAFGPKIPSWAYRDTHSRPPFFSYFTSGAEVMPNGNVYITEGLYGRLFEVTPQGRIVWQYTIPFASYTFRTEKYPNDYPAFVNRTFEPLGHLEDPPSLVECMSTSNKDSYADKCIDIQANGTDPILFNKATHPITVTMTSANGSGREVTLAPSQSFRFGDHYSPGLIILHMQSLNSCPAQTIKVLLH